MRDNYVQFFLYSICFLFDMWSLSFLISSLQMMRLVKVSLIVRTMWQGSKWQVFDGESDEVVCTVKEDKLDLKVFRAFNSPAQNQPDYKTKTNNMSLCMPWSLAILHEKQPLAEVSLKKSKWLHLNEYLVEMNEGADAVFVLLLVLMMHDMERMFASVKTISISPYRFYPALTF
jgi:hypothetical protein